MPDALLTDCAVQAVAGRRVNATALSTTKLELLVVNELFEDSGLRNGGLASTTSLRYAWVLSLTDLIVTSIFVPVKDAFKRYNTYFI